MPSYAFERLSAQENRFLVLEGRNTPMHVTSVAIHRLGPLATPGGGVDVARLKHALGALLHRLPRYRQKLKYVPVENHPVWVDDPHFNVEYHIRHAALPRPGTVDELKKKVARIMVQPLDRTRPLWETWIIEQLEGGRFALITKVHHCVLDLARAVDLGQIGMSPDAAHRIPDSPPYRPRPEPSGRELLGAEWRRRVDLPRRMLEGWRTLREESEGLMEETRERIDALAGLLDSGPSDTPLNGSVGPHRRFEWLTLALADMKSIHDALRCTLNDAVLAMVSGAVRRFLLHRHTDPGEVDFRVSIPLSVGAGDAEAPQPGGATSGEIKPFIIDLPIGEEDIQAQLGAIARQTEDLKTSSAVLGAQMIMAVAEWTPSSLFSRAARVLARPLPVNLSVSNVPGPQLPLYLEGGELLEWYGASPLTARTGLALSLVSYNGRLCWGFNADRDLVPDLPLFVKYVEESLADLARAAGVELKGLPPEAHAAPEAPAS